MTKNLLFSPSGLKKAEDLIKQTDLLDEDLLGGLDEDPSPLLLQSGDDLLTGGQIACSPVRTESPMMKKPHGGANQATKASFAPLAEDRAMEMAMADLVEEHKGDADFSLEGLVD